MCSPVAGHSPHWSPQSAYYWSTPWPSCLHERKGWCQWPRLECSACMPECSPWHGVVGLCETRNSLVPCSTRFSTRWRTVNVTSEQLRPLWKPHWDTATPFAASPVTFWPPVFQLHPREHCLANLRSLRFSFLGIGMRVHSCGTCLSSHTECTSSNNSSMNLSSSQAAFIISRIIRVTANFSILQLSQCILELSHGWCLC